LRNYRLKPTPLSHLHLQSGQETSCSQVFVMYWLVTNRLQDGCKAILYRALVSQPLHA